MSIRFIQRARPSRRVPRGGLLASGAAIALGLSAPLASAQSYRPEMTVVRAGKVITAAGREIENGEIVIEDGVITLVGVALDYPTHATVIEARDQTVMPGLVHVGTRYGLDNYRRSGIQGDKLAAADVIHDRIDFDPWLRAGFTSLAFLPPGDGIPGRASVFRTAGPTESLTLRRRGYLRVSMTDLPADKRTLITAITRARAEIKKVEDARAAWEKEQAERRQRAAQEAKPAGDAPKPDAPPPGGPRPRGGQAANEPAPGANNAESKPEEPATFTPPEIDPSLQPMVDLIQQREGALMVIELATAAGLLHLDDAIATALRPDPPAPPQGQGARQGQRPQQGPRPRGISDDPSPTQNQPPQGRPGRPGQGGGAAPTPAAESGEGDKPEAAPNLAHALRLTALDRGFNWRRVSFFGSPAMWSDYTRVVDQLAERKVPVIMTPEMVYLPQTVTRYNLAGELASRGVELVLVPRFEGGFGPEMFLNQVAMLVRDGLSREAAIASVTRNPARLLGISGRVGTIERGREADLIFLTGDPLDPASRVTRVLVAGQTVWELEEGAPR